MDTACAALIENTVVVEGVEGERGCAYRRACVHRQCKGGIATVSVES